MNIKVIPNELNIVETKNELIKLKNISGIILDVSGWFLKAGGAIFKFPDYSLVAANSELIISSDISGLKFADNKFSAEILYPNGSVAFSYSPTFASSSSKSKEIILSKLPEKKIEIAAGTVISKKNFSNTSSNSNSYASSADKSQNFTTEKNQLTGEASLASVITISEENNFGAKIWLILAVITGTIGATGVFLARKFTYTEK